MTVSTFGEPSPPDRPSRYAPATWPVRGSTSSSESSSPTCSMNLVPTRRHSSSRGRRVISYRTWCFASTTPSRHQGLSFRVRGPDSPNDEEERSHVRIFPGWLQGSVRDRHEVFSESVGCGAFPPSTSSLSTTRMCAEPTALVLEPTRPRRMRLYGATSVAHDGFSRGGYAAQGSSSSGLGRAVSSEPGAGDPRFASSDARASCCSISSVVRARHTLRSVGQPPPSKPSGMRGSACEIVLGEFLGATSGIQAPAGGTQEQRVCLDRHRSAGDPLRNGVDHGRAGDWMSRRRSDCGSTCGICRRVVHGRRDPLFPVGNGEALAREIPGARLLILDSASSAIPPAAANDVATAMLAL